MAIFSHTDSDDDELEARTHNDFPNDLFFDIARGYDNENSSVRVDRDAVLRLHAALGEWLYPVHTPEWANKSLIEQMIEKAVKDQVAAVLPLHLKTVATYATAPAETLGCECGHPADYHSEENGCCHWYAGDQEFCGCTRGLGGLESDAFPGADPEPHDVGHSEPYFPPLHMATESECRADSQNPCIAARHLVAEPETDHGRLMSELPVRTRPRPICVSCGHGWGEHTGGICWGGGSNGVSHSECTCTRQRPSTASTP